MIWTKNNTEYKTYLTRKSQVSNYRSTTINTSMFLSACSAHSSVLSHQNYKYVKATPYSWKLTSKTERIHRIITTYSIICQVPSKWHESVVPNLWNGLFQLMWNFKCAPRLSNWNKATKYSDRCMVGVKGDGPNSSPLPSPPHIFIASPPKELL